MVTKNQKTIIVGLTVAIIFVMIGVFFLSYAMETLDVKAEATRRTRTNHL